ncbi:Peroxisomal membrane protein 11C like protein [Argiope bruennichi]|uniref:Peroxisomal membrane protein 11C like protein n=2 Tax=Argiope bruennichi TaxID=94029 RepID=A0A8T0EM25_ARGBR|nr:Peroxisomal membrane protein 11C like protein [Argiope bruennichi]
MRLFDDFPMLRYSINYGLGSEEKTGLLRVLGVVKNMLDQIYYPIEHIALAADHHFLKVNSGSFYTAGTIIWGLSCYIDMIRSLIMMAILQGQTKGLKNVVLHEKIVAMQLEYLLLGFKDAADLALAIYYLPYGSFLWAGKLSKRNVGLFGTISSLIRVVMLLRSLKNEKSAS